MSKRVYLLVNKDSDEIICASEDKNFVNEVMCDCFMDDLMYEWYWYLTTIKYDKNCKLPSIAQNVWENIMEWYDDFMRIRVIEVV